MTEVSAFGVVHKGYNVIGTYTKPVKLARGKLLPVKAKKSSPKHKADVTPWEKYGVGKSYVPGKGFVSAVDAGKSALRAIEPGRYKKLRGVSDTDFKYRIDRAKTNVMVEDATKRTRKKGQMRFDPSTRTNWGFGRTGDAVEGFTVRRGSKSQGRNTVVLSSKIKRRSSADSTFHHEMAHAAPKRSEYRVHQQIGTNPIKRMREEARADMAGGTYYKNPEHHTDSGYAYVARKDAEDPNPNNAMLRQRLYGIGHEEAAAYRGVQDKIAGARKRG